MLLHDAFISGMAESKMVSLDGFCRVLKITKGLIFHQIMIQKSNPLFHGRIKGSSRKVSSFIYGKISKLF